jgi:hypothetical protein
MRSSYILFVAVGLVLTGCESYVVSKMQSGGPRVVILKEGGKIARQWTTAGTVHREGIWPGATMHYYFLDVRDKGLVHLIGGDVEITEAR